MSVKIGINGLGRIGKMVCRMLFDTAGLELVHINDKMSIDLMVHLLKYDSVHGKSSFEITKTDHSIVVNGKEITVTNMTTPEDIPWNRAGTDIVLESSGKYTTLTLLQGHIQNGVKKVILSCPAGDNSIDRTVVMGVNHQEILSSDRIISNASCTTNCVAVLLKVLMDEFGIKRAFMNTVHPFTNNQNLHDGFHSDYRRARSAFNNIIPTTSSAIKTTKIIFPELENIFDGFATRVPVADCSFVELTAQIGRNSSVEEINDVFFKYAANSLKSYLEYCVDPIVSSDVNNNFHSAVFDSLATKVIGGDYIQILAWYDNECGYSARIVDLIKYISK